MPWGVLILGAFLCGGATLMLNHFVTGTSDTDNLVKTVVPLALMAVLGLILVFGIFGGRK